MAGPSPLRRARGEASGAAYAGWYLAAAVSALLVPPLILVVGVTLRLLEQGDLSDSPVRLGHSLAVPIPEWLVVREPADQLIALVILGAVLGAAESLSLWFFYRGLQARCREASRRLHEQLLSASVAKAASEGISTQRRRAERLIEEHLPQLQQGLAMLWRAWPRSVLLVAACVTLALMIDIWLTSLAVVTGVLLWRLYRWLDPASGQEEAQGWELPRLRARLVEMVQQAPLIARFRDGDVVDADYHSQLSALTRHLAERERRRSRRGPLMGLGLSVALSVLLLALGAHVLDPDSPLSLPSALVMVLALGAAVIGATRLMRLSRRLNHLRMHAAEVYQFLDRVDAIRPGERVGLAGFREAIEMTEVTLPDSNQRPLLASLSLRLVPGSMVAVMGTDPVATTALVELLLGFGQPRSGRVTIDGLAISDLHPRSLARQVLWVGRDGPIWNGTVEDNLRGSESGVSTGDIAEAARRVGVYERLQNLSDGFATLITPDDGRLDVGTRYAIAVARAVLRRPAVVIVQEPPQEAGTLPDDPCLVALRELAREGSLVLVLPQRLQTLRAADRVVLINGGRVAGEGRHEELLASSDLYRHLNYVRFNPYRHLSGQVAAK